LQRKIGWFLKGALNSSNIVQFKLKNSFVKVAFLFFLSVWFTFKLQAQSIHHQMTSSQGASVKVSNKLMVHQTVGQQSVTGNYLGSAFSVGQGFQQGKFSKSKGPSALNIQIMTFPNPFTSKINFQFSASIDGLIKISIYDITGRVVMNSEKELLNNTISLENLNFPDGQYIVKLSAKNFNYTTNLIKMK
jgi:hypothetical protein